MKSDLLDVIEILETGEFTLVSYGLAPNPFGFCYEFSGEGKRDQIVEQRLARLLYGLSTKEEQLLLIKRYL